MIRQCVCSICKKEFTFQQYGDDFERECFKHEVLDHIKGDVKCEEIIRNVIESLNRKYGITASIKDYNFNPYYDTYGISRANEIEVSFKLKMNSEILFHIPGIYVDGCMSITENTIIDEIEKYYIEQSERKIVGVVKFEDWSGGHGEDDYHLNGMYMRDIMRRLEGKKIEIRIIED